MARHNKSLASQWSPQKLRDTAEAKQKEWSP